MFKKNTNEVKTFTHDIRSGRLFYGDKDITKLTEAELASIPQSGKNLINAWNGVTQKYPKKRTIPALKFVGTCILQAGISVATVLSCGALSKSVEDNDAAGIVLTGVATISTGICSVANCKNAGKQFNEIFIGGDIPQRSIELSALLGEILNANCDITTARNAEATA